MSSRDNTAVTRRLAAIVIADVVGYSRLMERDDTGTFTRLRSIRDEVVDPAIVSHDGRIVKTAGDGFLAEFPSALAALRASVQIQREMAKRNECVAAEHRIDYRIGVNLGDIMVYGTDIVGDGVNVAARLETLAEPGGICASEPVRDQVHGNLDVGFDDIGDQQVKNIARPIRAFAVRLGEAHTTAEATESHVSRSPTARLWSARRLARRRSAFAILAGLGALALVASYSQRWFRGEEPPGPPALSVGVLPLIARGGDSATAQRAEALTYDLTSVLTRADVAIRTVPAAPQPSIAERGGTREQSRALNVRYLLGGEVQPAPGATEIRLRLVNGASGEQAWSGTASLSDSMDGTEQSRTLRKLINSLGSRLFELEMQRATAAGGRAATPMDFALQAGALTKTDKTPDRFHRQEALCEEALRRDPDLVPALLCIYGALDGLLDVDSTVDRDRLIRRMDEVTGRAVHLNHGASQAWDARSGALMYMGRWDAAIEASAKAIALDPDDPAYVAGRAWSMSMVGRPAEAVALVAQAISIDPPGGWWVSRVGCEAHVLLGQYDQAIAACEKAAGLAGNDFDIAYFLAAAYAQTGSIAKATEETAKILHGSPGFTIAALRAKQYSTHPEYMRLAEEHWYSGLRKAGIPEK